MEKKAKNTKVFVEKPENKEQKEKVLKEAIAQIEKDFGKGALMKLGDRSTIEVEVIPTGSLTLDLALGVGGVPKSRIIEIYGAESSGKTTLALHIVAEAQKAGGIAGFIDAEHALDPVYAKKIGVDIDNLYISQPDNGEQGLEIAEMMVRSGAMDVIIIDSVAALVPKSEIEGAMTDLQVGMHARMMSKALRKLTTLVGKSGCVVIFINQVREKIGVMYGNPEVTTGGRALKFYSTIRMEVKKGTSIKDSGGKDAKIIGTKTLVKVVKNKVAPPFREAEFDIMYGEGISHESNLIELGVTFNIINKSGSWYSYNGEKMGQGVESAKQYLIENPNIAEEIESKIREIGLEKNTKISVEDEKENVEELENLDELDIAEIDFDENLDD